MNNENNNGIIFDNNKPLDNSTVDYNSLYNVNSNQTTSEETAIDEINQKIAEEKVIVPTQSAIENNSVSVNSKENKKSMAIVIIIGILILAVVIFLFPYLIKKGF